MTKIAFLTLVLIFSPSLIAWSPGTMKHWDATASRQGKHATGAAFATFWGGFRRAFHWPLTKGKTNRVLLGSFSSKIPLYISTKEKKTDLFIFYPGVFGEPDNLITGQVVEEFEKRNIHLAVVPNILALSYLSSRPLKEGDALEEEKKYQQNMVLEIVKLIGPEKIHKVHIVCESLGCLQALMTYLPESTPVKEIETFTLLWPPLYLDRAVRRFDDLIRESVAKEEECSYWWKWPRAIFETQVKSFPDNLSNEDKSCWGAWGITTGFVKVITEITKEVTGKRKITMSSPPGSFGQFIGMVLPEYEYLLKNNDSRLSVDHLMGFYRNDPMRFRIVSSQNDFLNEQHEWETLKKNHPQLSSRSYFFSWGGHSGPIGLETFLDSVLKDLGH